MALPPYLISPLAIPFQILFPFSRNYLPSMMKRCFTYSTLLQGILFSLFITKKEIWLKKRLLRNFITGVGDFIVIFVFGCQRLKMIQTLLTQMLWKVLALKEGKLFLFFSFPFSLLQCIYIFWSNNMVKGKKRVGSVLWSVGKTRNNSSHRELK